MNNEPNFGPPLESAPPTPTPTPGFAFEPVPSSTSPLTQPLAPFVGPASSSMTQGYAASPTAAAPAVNKNGLAVASLILGILALLTGILVISILFGAVAIILGL